METDKLISDHKFLGRKVIYSSREEIDESTIPSIINGAMKRHLENRAEIEYLFKYFKGDQPILKRVKLIRPDVNNRIVINNAYSIVRNANGYFLGEPIQYTAKKAEYSDRIAELNAFMDSENKSAEDMEIGCDASICGTAYRLIAVDEREDVDEAPFEIPTLEPQNTFVIYSTRVGHKPILGVTYFDALDDDGNKKGTTFTVYDETYQYIYTVKGSGTEIKLKDFVNKTPHFLGSVPIVEYPNNEFRIGDFEIVLSILNAINKLHSDRVNSVEQLVNSLLVFVNCDLKSAEQNKQLNKGDVSDMDSLKENLAISIQSTQGTPADIKFVNSQVDQNEAETLAQTLIDYVYAISGIPDRKQRSNGGGDTGDAVYLRDGFQSLEIVARVKERNFRKSERTVLRMVCRIIDKFNNIKLKPMQVDIRFVRNRTNNLQNKSLAAVNLEKTGLFAPEDIIALIGVTETPGEMARRGVDYYKSFSTESSTDETEKTVKTEQEENTNEKTEQLEAEE